MLLLLARSGKAIQISQQPRQGYRKHKARGMLAFYVLILGGNWYACFDPGGDVKQGLVMYEPNRSRSTQRFP